jgi:mRNA interferase HigB
MVYIGDMHIITKRPLIEFWINHPDAETPLKTWLSIMGGENFSDFVNLRATFGSADYVNGLTVFNIGGNKYRLIVSIHYNRHKVYIRAVLPHAEYDKDDWKRG